MQFMIKKHILCDHCRGSGAASDRDIHTCSGCGGSGVKLVKQQVLLTATRDGTGSSCAQRFSLGCSPKVRLHVTSVVAVAKLSPRSAHTAMEARSVPAILRVESLMLIPLFFSGRRSHCPLYPRNSPRYARRSRGRVRRRKRRKSRLGGGRCDSAYSE